jgi:hypothetical protein
MLLNYYSQTKMAKGEPFGYKTAILHLAPFDLSLKNVCPKASPECAAACLNTSGRGQMVSVQNARIKKTNYFWKNRSGFLYQLSTEIEQLKKRARNQGYKFAVRLNGTSDLAWHKFKMLDGQSVLDLHPDVQFYDYTKVISHLDHKLKNYHVTFSDSGRNDSDCKKAMKAGANVAVVFRDQLPKRWQRKKVIDGDRHDLRFLDPRGVIIGLIAKGAGRKQTEGGFIHG